MNPSNETSNENHAYITNKRKYTHTLYTYGASMSCVIVCISLSIYFIIIIVNRENQIHFIRGFVSLEYSIEKI